MYTLKFYLTICVSRFTPEQLGDQASSALVWLVIELVALTLSLYIMSLNTQMKYLDIIAFCGYKFVGLVIGAYIIILV